ncbi:MAG: aconitate hydratase AcnA [Fimbriimonadaceae bacterium]|nr:MAG: aconitate hydratase [Armatimonadetes bacterium OLB18]WKZ79508.1 MAG: aconitate hydratase AcnA [Fimbriimonadaceae bacterium]
MNSFETRSILSVGGKEYGYFSLLKLEERGFDLQKLPYSIRILLENLLRTEDGANVTAQDIEAVANWDPTAAPSQEISFTPARTLLQDFTGVPCVVDLAAMRDAMVNLGCDPLKIDPLQPVELVIDHSVQVDAYGSQAAIEINRDLEYQRNEERYRFLKWGQNSLRNLRVVPPNTGIVHQVNLEYLARVVMDDSVPGQLYPDTLVGTDSHTTMINGLGVLGWGVGGIEAEAAMLGQPISMLLPQVVGFRITGSLREGSTATDLVLTVTEMLRKKGVVGKFVEFFGPGIANLPVADRATLGNMAPEYGATCGLFPVDLQTLKYLELTGRSAERVALVEAYMRAQGLFATTDSAEPRYSDVLELDLATVEPSVAGPKRPQDRIRLSAAKGSFQSVLAGLNREGGQQPSGEASQPQAKKSSVALMDWEGPVATEPNDRAHLLEDGSIVIAAITSCTNTSNPSVMVGAGLLAKKAVERGLMTRPWVKTSLAPGSRVVQDYLERSGLLPYLNQLGFNVVGFGCTTCIGNSGPLPDQVAQEIRDRDLVAVSVLSGNRNFEGRINPDVKANYLMSPPLVVAYALAGTMNIDLQNDPVGVGEDGRPVYLRDIWPSQSEIAEVIATALRADVFAENYKSVFDGDEKWRSLDAQPSDAYPWDPSSTYVRRPPYFDGMSVEPPAQRSPIGTMKALAVLGDSVTTDHISPAGSIKLDSPAGKYLVEHGVEPKLFNSYGSRRGNHEVMMRGTFANVRLRNQLAPGTEGGFTTYLPTGEVTTIFDAAMKYAADGTPLLLIAGKEYGSGSSRDWAAKGPALLGVKVVLAESFERIHRSNLVGMGVLPLEFSHGESLGSLGLSGTEEFEVVGLEEALAARLTRGRTLQVRARSSDGRTTEFRVTARIDTPREVDYYLHGGILQYVLRSLAAG